MAERLRGRSGRERKVNRGALPCLLAGLLLPPGAGPATAAVSVLAGNRLIRRSWLDSSFNGGNVLLAGSLAAMVGAIGTAMGADQAPRAAAPPLLSVSANLLVAALPPALHTRPSSLHPLTHPAAPS